MRCWSERCWSKRCFALASLLALAGCSGDEGSGEGSGLAEFTPGTGLVTTLPPADPAPGVSNYERPLGMPIGQSAPAETDEVAGEPAPEGMDDEMQAGEEIEIPVFTPMDEAAPCSGCVELNVDVNDINQRNSFVFAGGGNNVTRVVWTIIVPFNSDQLFVQPFVDNNFGTFTDLDANAFAINTPVQLVHQYSGSAGTVGLAVGSSGAWTGNMTMSVFVDSVTLEGADPSASRTFDNDAQGLLAASGLYNPKIVYHP